MGEIAKQQLGTAPFPERLWTMDEITAEHKKIKIKKIKDYTKL